MRAQPLTLTPRLQRAMCGTAGRPRADDFAWLIEPAYACSLCSPLCLSRA